MKYLWLIISLAMLFGCASTKHNWYQQIEAKEFADKADAMSDSYIIDVRTAGEYEKGHMDRAINISYLSPSFRKKIKTLDSSKPVLIYCHSMHRSPLAAKKLKRVGFPLIIDLKDGFKTWREAGLKVVK